MSSPTSPQTLPDETQQSSSDSQPASPKLPMPTSSPPPPIIDSRTTSPPPPSCTKCNRVYQSGKAEGLYDGFRAGIHAGREVGYLEGFSEGLAAAMKMYREWGYQYEYEAKQIKQKRSSGTFFKG